MNNDITQGKWHQILGKAKQVWGDLTDDDIKHAEGGAEHLRGVIQEKYGKSKQEAQKLVDDFVKRFH